MEAMTRSFRKGITLKKRASMLRELGQNEAADALMDAVREIDTLKSRLENEPPIRLVWSQEKLEKEIYEQQIDQVAIKHHRGREMSKAQDQEWLKERWAGLRGDIETFREKDEGRRITSRCCGASSRRREIRRKFQPLRRRSSLQNTGCARKQPAIPP
jgi:hypothetical protein